MNIYSAIASNKRKSILIMVFFVVFIATLGYIYGKGLGFPGEYAGYAFFLASVMSVGSYFYSDQIVLATSGAKPVKKSDNPALYRIVENLAIGDGIPTPKIYVIDSPSPNAFSTGRGPKHAVVCVTTGLLEKLNKVELEGVLAHELSHIKNYDIRLMGIVAVLVGFVAILGNIFMRSLWFSGGRERDREENNASSILLLVGIIFAILSPVIATIIQLAVSRKREFLADASAALLTRYPEGLASALDKISKDPRVLSTAGNATAHLFIVNPFKGKNAGVWFASLFDTHPPIEERIKILRSM